MAKKMETLGPFKVQIWIVLKRFKAGVSLPFWVGPYRLVGSRISAASSNSGTCPSVSESPEQRKDDKS